MPCDCKQARCGDPLAHAIVHKEVLFYIGSGGTIGSSVFSLTNPSGWPALFANNLVFTTRKEAETKLRKLNEKGDKIIKELTL